VTEAELNLHRAKLLFGLAQRTLARAAAANVTPQELDQCYVDVELRRIDVQLAEMAVLKEAT
jgi:hypothetical protein